MMITFDRIFWLRWGRQAGAAKEKGHEPMGGRTVRAKRLAFYFQAPGSCEQSIRAGLTGIHFSPYTFSGGGHVRGT